MKKIKIGILGTANIAIRSIIPQIKNLESKFELIGIASRSKEKADDAAKKFNTKPFYNYNDIIDSSIIDAVYIPLPNSLHFKYSKMALLKGIHVLVEKPTGCSFQEVQELVNIAKMNDKSLVENFQFRFHNQLEFLMSTLESGIIGELRSVISAFCFPPFPSSSNIRYKKELGGGALLDAAAYTVKASSIILGDNLRVKSSGLNSSKNFEVDIWGSAHLVDTELGYSSTCIFGFDNFYQCGIQIIGSLGKISTNRLFTARENFSPTFEIEINGKDKKVVVLEPDNHFKKMLIHFHKTIFDKASKEQENIQNLIQAQLLQDIKNKSNEK